MPNRSYYTEQMLADEQFMQFPKWLMQDKEFSKLSNDAKVLYCLLKDRFKLSSKNHWIDKDGRVFVVCKEESMSKLLHKTEKSARKYLTELIEANLIEKKQNGLNKPNFLYLLMPKFSENSEESFEEDNWTDKQTDDNSSWTGKNYHSEPVKNTLQKGKSLPTNKTNSSNNNSNKPLNNNIDNTYESKPVVVEKDLVDYVNSVIYKSNLFDTYVESGNTNSFINAAERVLKNIKNQSKKRRENICYFDENQITNLLNAALDIENDTYGTIINPDGYVVSKINEEIEKTT